MLLTLLILVWRKIDSMRIVRRKLWILWELIQIKLLNVSRIHSQIPEVIRIQVIIKFWKKIENGQTKLVLYFTLKCQLTTSHTEEILMVMMSLEQSVQVLRTHLRCAKVIMCLTWLKDRILYWLFQPEDILLKLFISLEQ